MEIDGCGDFEIHSNSEFDLGSSDLNGRQVHWLLDFTAYLHRYLPQYSSPRSLIRKAVTAFFDSGTNDKARTVAGQHFNENHANSDSWDATQAFVNFCFGQNWGQIQALGDTYSVTGRISLNELLAANYLDREIQIVPFALDWDANLSWLQLPDGVSWASLQAPIGAFQSYFPQGIELLTLDRGWWAASDFHAIAQVETYLNLISSKTAEILAAAQLKAVELAMEPARAATQAVTEASAAATAATLVLAPYTAIEQAKMAQEAADRAKKIATAAEHESLAAEAFAKTKAKIADVEKQKAIEITTKAILATEPPNIGRSGYLTKPREYIIQEWNKERAIKAAEAESQSNIAGTAAAEAKIASAIAAAKMQATAVAKEQAKNAERIAMQANSYAFGFAAATPYFDPDLPLTTLGYHHTIQTLDKVLEINPINPTAYLQRGSAYFSLGKYDLSLQDYQQFTSQVQNPNPLSISQFSLGFAKGLPTGTYESGKGLFLFLVDFATHPIHTSEQVFNSITTLVDLVRNDEWAVIADSLSPEIYQLVTEWDALPSEKKGELAGYALGKLGTDILAPGALAKVASKTVKSAQELAAVCKNLQLAQETLILEAAAGIGDAVKISEIVSLGQKTAFFAEELGFSAKEVGGLKQSGQLETTVVDTVEYIAQNPAMRESFELFKKAQKFLKPYREFMSESQVRELIHQTGIKTFPRPEGIPDNFRIKITDKGAGMKYVHPNNEQTYIRIMPGKPHSPLPYQQKPYVSQMRDGEFLDKFGNVVYGGSQEAHIPLEEFICHKAWFYVE